MPAAGFKPLTFISVIPTGGLPDILSPVKRATFRETTWPSKAPLKAKSKLMASQANILIGYLIASKISFFLRVIKFLY